MTYQIKDWDKHFENDRSRQREKCSFVCVPNKQHGMGFCRVMAEPDGSAIYGVWHLIVGACSQQTKRNGWLTSDGESAGAPWGVDDLALKFRRPEKEINRALQVLCSEKVGWLVTVESPSSHHDITVVTPLSTLKEEKEGKEENGSLGFLDSPNTALPDPIQLRLGALFHRRPTTKWSESELKAYRKARPVDESDLRILEDYYRANIPKDSDYRRHDLSTLLNNFSGELDRARNFRPSKPF